MIKVKLDMPMLFQDVFFIRTSLLGNSTVSRDKNFERRETAAMA